MSFKTEEIIRLKKEGVQQREISRMLDCSEGYVSRFVKQFGLSNDIHAKFIGELFGQLTPIKYVGKDPKSHKSIYLCLCSCGKTVEVLGNSLQSKNTESCGCTSRKRGKDHANFKGYEDISITYWNSVMFGAKSRKLTVAVTIKDIWDLFIEQDRKCALSGVKLGFATTRKTAQLQTASLDRIDASKGYIKGNVQWIHKHLNAMKWKLTDEDFIGWCREVVKYQDQKDSQT